jgi:hypothetical protein
MKITNSFISIAIMSMLMCSLRSVYSYHAGHAHRRQQIAITSLTRHFSQPSPAQLNGKIVSRRLELP